MTSIQRLRLLRPIVRTPQVAIPFRSFHVGRPSGTSRLQNGAAGRTQDGVEAEREKDLLQKGESMSEFKKMRIKALEEVTGDWSEALVKDRYPRLKHMTKKVSVPVFKKRWIKEKLEKPSEEIVTLYGTQNQCHQAGYTATAISNLPLLTQGHRPRPLHPDPGEEAPLRHHRQ